MGRRPCRAAAARCWPLSLAIAAFGWPPATVRAAAPPPAHRQATTLSLPPARERPAHRAGVAVGGAWPAGAVLELEGLWGLAPLVAARTSLSALWSERERAPRGAGFDGVVLLGPDLVFDTFAWVPHVFVQGGARVAPVAPAVAFGASLERFVSLHTRLQVGATGLWRGHGGGLRAQLLVGVGRTLD